jgi:hypothetical protein
MLCNHHGKQTLKSHRESPVEVAISEKITSYIMWFRAETHIQDGIRSSTQGMRDPLSSREKLYPFQSSGDHKEHVEPDLDASDGESEVASTGGDSSVARLRRSISLVSVGFGEPAFDPHINLDALSSMKRPRFRQRI